MSSYRFYRITVYTRGGLSETFAVTDWKIADGVLTLYTGGQWDDPAWKNLDSGVSILLLAHFTKDGWDGFSAATEIAVGPP